MKARDFTLRKYLSSLSLRASTCPLSLYIYSATYISSRASVRAEGIKQRRFDPPRRSFWPAATAADANGLAIALVLADDRLGPGSESHPQRQPITTLSCIPFVSFRFLSFLFILRKRHFHQPRCPRKANLDRLLSTTTTNHRTANPPTIAPLRY